MVLPGWSIAGRAEAEKGLWLGLGFSCHPAVPSTWVPNRYHNDSTTRKGKKSYYDVGNILQGTVFNWAQRVRFACRTHQRSSWVRSCRAPARPGATSCKVLTPSTPQTHPQDLHAATNQRNPFSGAPFFFLKHSLPRATNNYSRPRL